MIRSGVQLPEPFASALRGGRAADVRDEAVADPAARFARALARIDVGDEEGARRDLNEAEPHFADACQVEKAFLDIRQRSALMAALCAARDVSDKKPGEPTLRARALHVLGLAQGKMRRTAAALDALLEAVRHYALAGDVRGRSQVHDTLGMLEAARGRLDLAVYWYALSLVDKALIGDRLGMAITLGNLGRLHLRAGRFDDALDCFARDLRLAEDLEDTRGQARMHEDIGRAHAGREDPAAAERAFRRAIEMSESHGFRDIAFFAWRDLCELFARGGDVAGATHAYETAQGTLPRGGERYLELLLALARAELMSAQGDPEAAALLSRTVEALKQANLPDQEIPARLLLARALAERGDDAEAERCLMNALTRARRAGYARYLAPLNEALTALGLVEDTLAAEVRPLRGTADAASDAYVLRKKVGAGSFGEVYRAYDPQRNREVAYKRLLLDGVYEPAQRAFIETSARIELEAASRVRHPGVVRVFALGTEGSGGMYVVQEFVEGASLAMWIEREANPEPGPILAVLTDVAYALEALHEAGVVHRDLKPDNVIVRPDGTPVLVDFGIAHVARRADAGEDLTVVGTLPYMSPEHVQGRKLDGRSDLYALGVLAFELLTGVLPLKPRGETPAERARCIGTTPPAKLSEYRPDLPDELGRVLDLLLAKKPRRRPERASDAAGMFEALRASL